MTNLRTDEIVFFLYLTKIGIDENKAIYSICEHICITCICMKQVIQKIFQSLRLTMCMEILIDICNVNLFAEIDHTIISFVSSCSRSLNLVKPINCQIPYTQYLQPNCLSIGLVCVF